MQNEELTPMQYNLWHYVYGALVIMCGIKIMNWQGEVSTDWNHSIDTGEIANLLTIDIGPEELRGKDFGLVHDDVTVVINAMADAGLVGTQIVGPEGKCPAQQVVWLEPFVGVFRLQEYEVRYYKRRLRLANVLKIKPDRQRPGKLKRVK